MELLCASIILEYVLPCTCITFPKTTTCIYTIQSCLRGHLAQGFHFTNDKTKLGAVKSLLTVTHLGVWRRAERLKFRPVSPITDV